MHIEDIIILMAMASIKVSKYDSAVIYSLFDQISNANGFTEKQSALAVRIISRYITEINNVMSKDITLDVQNPKFRLPIRTLVTLKTIAVVDNKEYGKVFKMQFPFDHEIVNRLKSKAKIARWNQEEKAWLCPVNEKNLNMIMEISSEHDFNYDETFRSYIKQANSIKENFEAFVPSLTHDGFQFTFKNVHENVPKLQTNDVLEALFFARKVGIQIWDERVTDKLTEISPNESLLKFFNTPPDEKFNFNTRTNDISELEPFLKYLGPTLITIPGGSEMEKVQLSLSLAAAVGIPNSNISVMFRLPNETGSIFNKFIKDNDLNNSITDSTQLVLVSGKLPKPVIDSKIRFNGIIDFNFYGIHHTIKDLLNNHHNVINITNKQPVGIFNFADM